MKSLATCIAVGLVLLSVSASQAGTVSGVYFPLEEGDTIDLTAEGTLDWIKFGNGENNTSSFLNTTKIGNPVFLPASLAPVGTPPDAHTVELIAFTGEGLLNFEWGNGNFGMYNGTGPVDTVVTETISPNVNDYPIGLGATFDATAISLPRVMNVYVQGFNADMFITASMSGGGLATALVTPNINPASSPTNDYAVGYFQITYSGAGELLTVTVNSQDPRTDGAGADFANAGFFAATVEGPLLPEPSSIALAVMGVVSGLAMSWRGRRS